MATPNKSSSGFSKKKYKLCAMSSTNGGPPPCAFFISAAGCRNGDACKFSHDSAASSKHHSGGDADSVVSSESSVGGQHQQQQQQQQHGDNNDNVTMNDMFVTAAEMEKNKAETTTASKKKKRKSAAAASPDAFPFANPKKPKTLEDTEVVEVVVAATATKPPPLKEEKPVKAPPVAKEKKVATPTAAASKRDASAPSFRDLLKDLPIAKFTMPGTLKDTSVKTETEETPAPAAEESAAAAAAADVTNPPAPPAAEEEQHPLPQSHPAGRKWLSVVEQARKHARFARDYSFSKYQDEDEESGFAGKKAWVVAHKYHAGTHENLPQVLAMDCEMCETKDPVSGKKDPRALCRISVVDVATDEVLLDTLVKPAWPVIDYRSWVNGITAKDLENVQFTLRHAQAFMMSLCSDETVILGHALQNDLAAIRMEHYCVADSAYLFQAKDSPSSSVALRDLAASILQKTMPNKHDSVNDARTAWKCLEHYLENDGKVEPIERTPRTTHRVSTIGMQLFVHRIPKSCDENHLKQMFLAYSCVQPDRVNPIEFNGNSGKTVVMFRSVHHANVAFDTIEGKADADPSGRLQKKVFLKSGGYIRVRKMAYDHKRSSEGKEQPRRASNSSI